MKIKKANIINLREVWILLKKRSPEEKKKFDPMYAEDIIRLLYLFLSKKIDFLLFYKRKKVVGFISIRRDTENLFSIFVKEEYRGQGIGTNLILEAHKKYEALTLLVKESNNGALKLYKRLGFKEIEKEIKMELKK